MLQQITEKIAQWEIGKFAPIKDANLERYRQFVDATKVSDVSESGLRADVIDWCATNSKSQQRISRYVNNGLVTTHGLGNEVSYLQTCKKDSREINEIWYLDHKSGKGIEIMSGFRQYKVPVFAGVTPDDTLDQMLGQKYEESNYLYDRRGNKVHLPGDKFSSGYLRDKSPLDMLAIVTIVPLHELSHAITFFDKEIHKATMVHDLARGIISSVSNVKHHIGSSAERLAMIGAFEVIQKAVKSDVNVWRGHEAKSVILAINKRLHW